jgi:hypothetical protein
MMTKMKSSKRLLKNYIQNLCSYPLRRKDALKTVYNNNKKRKKENVADVVETVNTSANLSQSHSSTKTLIR